MKKLLCLLVSLLAVIPAGAQASGTGAYPFAPLSNVGFDQINLANLNVRFSIPIISRLGRGTPFNYAIQYEGMIWSAIDNGTGSQTWTPDPTWGFNGSLNGTVITGYLTNTTYYIACPGTGHVPPREQLGNFQYHDAFGAVHRFQYTVDYPCPNDVNGQITTLGSGAASDGSGLTLVNQGTQVQKRDGTLISPGYGPGTNYSTSITDANGNQITSSGSVFTDTLGASALTLGGGASPSSPTTFTYPVTLQANGGTTTQAATLSYTTYTVRTNFQCSSVGEYGSTSVSLPSQLMLADGSTYTFSYEGTPGATDGAVTGRLGSVILPTGGTVAYTYRGGCSSAGAGINPDGTVGALTRSTADGPRAFDRGQAGSGYTTTVTDEKNNVTVYNFSTDSNTNYFYETHRQVYQGSNTSGGSLLDQYTCYNGQSANCDGIAVTAPITSVRILASNNNGTQAQTVNTYDGNGTLITSSQTPSGTTQLTYNSLGEVTSVNSFDGSNTNYASTTYNYDETSLTSTSGLPQHTAGQSSPGNLTSVQVTGSPNINTSISYYDTGMAKTSTGADGGQSGYSYDPTGAFVTGTTLPTPSSLVALSTSASYDATSASLLNSHGMNGEPTTVNQYDALMRPTNISLPSGSTMTVEYPTATNGYVATVTQTQDLATSRTATSKSLMDGYGRVITTGTYNGQIWYNVDSCYDAAGFLQFQSIAYAATNFTGNSRHCSGAGTGYAYDGRGRITGTTVGSQTATTEYQNRAVRTTSLSGIKRETQYDLVGRITKVCEVTATALATVSPTACGTDFGVGNTGFITTYSYDLASHLTTILQGGQTRKFQTDAAGRTTSVTEPELSAATTYTYAYNSIGLDVTRYRPAANHAMSSSPSMTQTDTQYDLLGRVVSVTYYDGLTPNKNYYYDGAVDMGFAHTSANAAGRLNGMTSGATKSQYSYDPSGNVVAMWECAPSTCSNTGVRPGLSFTYDLAGALMSEYDETSGNIQYGRDAAEETTSVTNTSYTDAYSASNSVTNVVNSPFGPTNWTQGNNTSVVRSFDALGRNNGSWLCAGGTSAQGQSASCPGNTQLYGYIANHLGSQVVSHCDTVLNQCVNHSYDDLNRMTANGGFQYTYDRWNNRISQTGSTPSVSFNIDSATNHNSAFSYDAAGNQTNDSLHNSYTYDAEGRVLSVDNGSTATYVYDAGGNRVRATVSGDTYEYVYDPFGRRTSSWHLDGSASGFGNEGRIYWDYGLLANRSQDGTTYFHQTDWLGTERIRTDYQGDVANTITSQAFGDGFSQTSTNTTGGAQDNNHFTSQDRDAESGTTHFQFRQYHATSGRWMSPDPYRGSYNLSKPQSFNRYTYAMNNPLAMIDPSGLVAGSDCGGGGLGDTGSADQPCTPTGYYGSRNGPGSTSSGGDGMNTDTWISDFDFGVSTAQFCYVQNSYVNGEYDSSDQFCDDADLFGPSLAPNNGGCQLVAPGGNYNVGPNAVALFQPPMANALTNAFNALNSQGIKPTINSGYRSPFDQARMQNGGSGPNPAALISWHQVGMAVDINGTTSSFFPSIISAMQAQGLTWGGTFTHRDPPHFQLPRAGTSPTRAMVSACGGGHG